MHAEVQEWVSRYATDAPVSVVDLGGRDVNGSTRPLWPNASRYVVVDIQPGDNVDVVADAASWRTDERFDVVVCTEVFEHTDAWPDICRTAFELLHPGGRFIVTCAGPGRAPHSAVDGKWRLLPGEYYANVAPHELEGVLVDVGFVDVEVDQRHNPADVRAVATKPRVGIPKSALRLVGEHGPELILPAAPGQVLPNRRGA